MIHKAVVHEVIDGDTLRVTFLYPVTLRLADVDTPEMGTPEGEAAKAYLEGFLPVGSTVSVEPRTEDRTGGRIVAHVEVDTGTRLREAGHAKRWP